MEEVHVHGHACACTQNKQINGERKEKHFKNKKLRVKPKISSSYFNFSNESYLKSVFSYVLKGPKNLSQARLRSICPG